MDQKICFECGTVMRGRRDKKFCDDSCRNAHYNRQHSDEVYIIRNIHNLLRRNRRILEALLPSHRQKAKVTLQKLLANGFSLKYHTHVELTRLGNPRYFCYEYGYQKVNDEIIIFKKELKSVA